MRFHVIDFEGTPRTGAVEYGVVTLWGKEIEAVHTRLCRPDAPIPFEDTLIHGIENHQSARMAPLRDDFELFRSCRMTGPLCAHHAPVEDRFLKAVWAIPGEVPSFYDTNTVNTWGPWIDTCALYKRLYRNVDSHSLTNLTATFGLQNRLTELAQKHCPSGRRRAHAALYDALAAALLIGRLMDLSEMGPITLNWLMLEGATTRRARNQIAQLELF